MKFEILKGGAALVATACACVLATASPALATATYHYEGVISPTNSRDGGIVSYIDLHAPITFDFTVAAPLAANLHNLDIKASVLAWTVSGGKAQSTVDSTYPHALLSHLRITTDTASDITGWQIFGSADDLGLPAVPGYSLAFQYASGGAAPEHLDWINKHTGQAIGGAVSHGPTGLFAMLPPAPGVPEPAAWMLMIAGFGLVGATLRRRAPLAA